MLPAIMTMCTLITSEFRRSKVSGFSLCFIAAVLLIAANSALGHPDLIQQIKALDEQLATDPENVELLCKRGDLHRRHEDFKSAERDFKLARAADPDHAAIDFLEAELLLDMGQPEPAEKMLSRYLSLLPGHGYAWVLRGKAYIRLGKPASAAQDFASAIRVSPRPSPEVYRLQIMSLAAGGSDHIDETLKAVDTGLDRFPYEVNLLGIGVDIALAANRVEHARKYLANLPGKLDALPQWAARINTAECQENADPDRDSVCLEEARGRLDMQIRQFMSET